MNDNAHTDLQRLLPATWQERMLGESVQATIEYSATVVAASASGADTPAIDDWAVRRFELTERLDAPYLLRLQLVAPTDDVELDGLVGQRVEFLIAHEQTRTVQGVCTRAEIAGVDPEGLSIVLEVEPAFALLARHKHSRVFQDMTVPEVLSELLDEVCTSFDANLSVALLSGEHQPRDYSAQYRETDLEYALRLCSEAGIAVAFDHAAHADHGERAGETLVLVDDVARLGPHGHEPLEAGTGEVPILAWRPAPDDGAPGIGVLEARVTRALSTARHTTMRWDWMQRPGHADAWTSVAREPKAFGTDVEVELTRADEGPAGHGPIRHDAMAAARLHRDRACAEAATLLAATSVLGVRLGAGFELSGHPNEAVDGRWRPVEIVHYGGVPAASLASSEDGPTYGNRVRAQRFEAPYQPPPRPKPRIDSVQTAIVTSPDDEPIHTDRFGRIRVRMLWDENAGSHPSSCWLRVALPWAGDGFGSMFIPRAGSEVVVSFVNGDPDRPLCTGCVHSGASMPPYALPEHRSRTVLRTQSTDRGGGYNELSFEDAAGQEEVFLRAQRNLREHVRHAHTTRVGGCQELHVGGDRNVTVERTQSTTILGDRTGIVTGHDDLMVKKSARVHVLGDLAPGGRALDVSVDNGPMHLTVPHGIEIVCGGSRITISPDKITMVSDLVDVRARTIVASTPGPSGNAGAKLALAADVAELTARRQVLFQAEEGGARLTLDECARLASKDDNAILDLRGEQATLEAKAVTTVSAGSLARLAGGTCSIEGAQCEVRGTTAVTIESEGTATFTAQAGNTIRGQPIRLN
jgi:type VI secretion system secreted protein VgrG